MLAIGALPEGLSFALFSGNQEAFLFDTLKDEEASGLGVASMLTHAFGMIGFRAAGSVIRRWREVPVLLWTSITSIALGVGATAVPTIASPAISSVCGGGICARLVRGSRRAAYALLSAELMTISVVLLYWRLYGREARA